MKNTKAINNYVAVLLWIIGIGMLGVQSEPFVGAFFFLPYALGPQVMTHGGIVLAKDKKTQIILFIALLGYFAWFTAVYLDVFFIHVDANGALALLFIGVYALPVMVALWIWALWWN